MTERINRSCLVASISSLAVMLVISAGGMVVNKQWNICLSYPFGNLNLSAIVLEAYIIVSYLIYKRVVLTMPRLLVNFYLADKVLKMILAIAIMIIQLTIGVKEPLVFATVFFIMYLGSIVVDSIFFSHTEKELSNEMVK